MKEMWCLDSGAAHHMIPCELGMYNFVKLPSPIKWKIEIWYMLKGMVRSISSSGRGVLHGV